MTDNPKIPRHERSDVNNDHGLNDCDSFDDFIEYFQNLKDKYTREYPNAIKHNISIEIEFDDAFSGWAYLNIISARMENDTEYKERCDQKIEYDKIYLKEEKEKLQKLMNKYPKEVFNWMVKTPKK